MKGKRKVLNIPTSKCELAARNEVVVLEEANMFWMDERNNVYYMHPQNATECNLYGTTLHPYIVQSRNEPDITGYRRWYA